MFNTLMWGTLLILWGLTIIIKALFGISIPLFRFVIAAIFIYVGISLLSDNAPVNAQKNISFGKGTIKGAKNINHYNVLFGQGTIDLTDISPSYDKTTKIKINTAFGQSNIKLNPDIPTRIKLQAACGKGKLPNGEVYFGFQEYNTSDKKPVLEIKASVLFGELNFITS